MTLIEKLKESSAFITNRTGEEKIDIAIVLGSGLGDLADELEDAILVADPVDEASADDFKALEAIKLVLEGAGAGVDGHYQFV